MCFVKCTVHWWSQEEDCVGLIIDIKGYSELDGFLQQSVSTWIQLRDTPLWTLFKDVRLTWDNGPDSCSDSSDSRDLNIMEVCRTRICMFECKSSPGLHQGWGSPSSPHWQQQTTTALVDPERANHREELEIDALPGSQDSRIKRFSSDEYESRHRNAGSAGNSILRGIKTLSLCRLLILCSFIKHKLFRENHREMFSLLEERRKVNTEKNSERSYLIENMSTP